MVLTIIVPVVEKNNGFTSATEECNATKKNAVNESLKRVRKLSKMTEKMSKTMVNGVGIATGSVRTPMVRFQAAKNFLTMVPGQVLLDSLDAVREELVEENVEELAALDCINAGELFHLGKVFDIPAAAMNLRYYAGAADKIHRETLKMSRELHGYTLREPNGVVEIIIH